jgi:hypothetical protein
MIDSIRKWRYGVCELKKTSFPYVRMLRVVPTRVDLNQLKIMEEVFKIIHKRKSVFSFEIWNGEEFYFHSSKKEWEGELVSQLNTVYPGLEVEATRFSMPELDRYICGGSLSLKGQPFHLKTLEDFDYDPLIHVIEAIDLKCIIQVVFKPYRKILEIHNNGSEHPIFACAIRVITSSNDYKKARKSCEKILNSFTIFNSTITQLEPKIISFPLLRDSHRLLKQVAKRKLPWFSKILMTSKELAGVVHLDMPLVVSPKI